MLKHDSLLILVAPNVSEQMGGEAIKALHIFQEMSAIHANTLLVTHERNRRDDRRPRREEGAEAPAAEAAPEQPEAAPSFDPALLPPSISATREEAPAEEVAAPKPRRRSPRRKPSADDAGETLESVN